jgi:hypothetical protein
MVSSSTVAPLLSWTLVIVPNQLGSQYQLAKQIHSGEMRTKPCMLVAARPQEDATQ